MSDRPDLGERLAHAYQSHDLRHKPGRCDADVLGAAGMVSCSVPIFSALARLKYGNDAKSYPAAIEALSGIAYHMDRKDRWRSTRQERAALAGAVIRYWIAPNCRLCTGLKFLRMPDAPTLEPRACPACGGSGDVGLRLPRHLPIDPWYHRAQALLAWTQRQEADAGGRLMQKLSSRLNERPSLTGLPTPLTPYAKRIE